MCVCLFVCCVSRHVHTCACCGADCSRLTLRACLCFLSYIRLLESPSPALTACDVVNADGALRTALGCTTPPLSAAAAAVEIHVVDITAGVSTLSIGSVDTVLPATAYTVWLVASDFSHPPNLQATPFPVHTQSASCTPCGVGEMELRPCTATSDAVCVPRRDESCAAGWEYGGDRRCYRVTASSLSFSDAVATCSHMGGELATSASVEEAAAISAACVGARTVPGSTMPTCWVGMWAPPGDVAVPVWLQSSRTQAPLSAPWLPTMQVELATPLAEPLLCGYVHPRPGNGSDFSTPAWVLDECSTPRPAVCATPARRGLRVSQTPLTCSSPGCTASGTLSSVLSDTTVSVSLAQLDVVVQQLDLAGAAQRVDTVALDGVAVSACPLGRGGQACAIDDWRLCTAAPVAVDISSATRQVSAAITASSAVATPCDGDGAVLSAVAYLATASVTTPSPVQPRVSSTTGDAVTVAWTWPEDSGGAPIDAFSAQFGLDTVSIPVSGSEYSVTRLLQGLQVVTASSSDHSTSLAVECPPNTAVVFGFSMHLPADPNDALTACMLANNKPCTSGATACAQSACVDGSGDALRQVWATCNVVAAIPSWAAASSAQQLVVDTDQLVSAEVQCPALSTVLFGISSAQVPVYADASAPTAAEDSATLCAQVNTFSCPNGQTSCAQAGCETTAPGVYSLVYALCAPAEVVAAANPVHAGVFMGPGGSAFACPLSTRVGWSYGVYLGDTGGRDHSPLLLRMGLATATSVRCPTGDDACGSPPLLAGFAGVAAVCFPDTVLRPSFTHTFTGASAQFVGNVVTIYASVAVSNSAGAIAAFGALDVDHVPTSRALVPTQPGAPNQPQLGGQGATGGQLHVVWNPPADSGGAVGGVTGFAVAAAVGACTAEGDLPGHGSASELPAPVFMFDPTMAASSDPTANTVVVDDRSPVAVSATLFGSHGNWRRVGLLQPSVGVDGQPTSTVVLARPASPVSAVRVTFPVSMCGQNVLVAEVEVAAVAGGPNIAHGRPVSATNAASIFHVASTLTDGAHGSGSEWLVSCVLVSGKPYAIIHLGRVTQVAQVTIRWGNGTTAGLTGVKVSVMAPATPPGAFATEAGGAMRFNTLSSVEFLVPTTCHQAFVASAQVLLARTVFGGRFTSTAWSMEVWLRVVRVGSVPYTVAVHGLARLGIKLTADALVAVDFSSGMREYRPAFAPSPCVRTANASYPPPAVGSGATAESPWMHVLVAVSPTGGGGLYVDGELTGNWPTECQAVSLPGVVQVPTFPDDSHPDLAPASANRAAWDSSTKGQLALLVTDIVDTSDLGDVHPAEVFAGGAMTIIGGSPKLAVRSAQAAFQEALAGPKSTWQDIDVEVTLELGAVHPSRGGFRTLAFRYINRNNYQAVGIQSSPPTAHVWAVRAGIAVDVGTFSLSHVDLGASSSAKLRVVAYGQVVRVSLNDGLLASLRMPKNHLPLAESAIVVGYADGSGVIRDATIISVDPVVRLGIEDHMSIGQHGGTAAASSWGLTAVLVAQVRVYDAVVSAPQAYSEMSVARPAFADPVTDVLTCTFDATTHTTGGGIVDGFTAAGDDPFSGWLAPASVAVAPCEVDAAGTLYLSQRMYPTYDSGQALGAGGLGFQGVTGSLVGGTWASRVLSSRGLVHTHLLVYINLVLTGNWAEDDAVRVYIDDTIQWQGGYVSPANCDGGWVHYAGFCYLVSTEAVTWTEALEMCSDDGVGVVSFRDDAERVAVGDMAGTTIWTGLTDVDVDGRYVWVDGSGYTYRRWDPKAELTGPNDCTVLSFDGFLTPTSCGDFETHHAVCKKPVSGTQCGPDLDVQTVSIATPHTADSATLRVEVEVGDNREAAVMVLQAWADWRHLHPTPVPASPLPFVSESIDASGELFLAGLQAETEYCVAAAATSPEGTGPAGAAATFTTTVPTPPGPPRDVSVDGVTAGSIALQWSPPRDTGGLPLVQYVVRFRRTLDGQSGGAFSAPQPAFLQAGCGDDAAAGSLAVLPHSPCATLGHLTARTRYDVEVVAVNFAGEGAATTVGGITTDDVHASLPPSNLRSVAATGGSITLAWDSPFDTGGTPVLRYVVRYEGSTTGAREVAVDGNPADDSGSFTILGLPNNTDVAVSVAAHNLPSCLPMSSFVETSVSTTAPTPPTAPLDLAVVTTTGGSATLRWRQPLDLGGVPLLGFRVFQIVDDSKLVLDANVTLSQWQASAVDGFGGATVGGLTHTTRYMWVVAAYNAAGQSPPAWFASGVTTRVSTPSPPTAVAASGVAGDSVVVSWQPPLDTGGVDPAAYLVMQRVAAAQTVEVCSTPTLSCTLHGLVANTNYVYHVVALNAEGASERSSDVSTSTTAPTVPTEVPPPSLASSAAQCDNVNALVPSCNPSGGSIRLALGGVFRDGGAPVTVYTVEQEVSGGVWEVVYTGDSPSFTVSNLSPHTLHTFRQRVGHGAGMSAPSTALQVSTSAASKPDAPTALAATSTNASRVCLAWTVPSNTGGAPVVSYVVYQSVIATTALQCLTPGDSSCVVAAVDGVVVEAGGGHTCIRGLFAQTQYRFRVAAVNSAASSALSSAMVVDTLAPYPASAVQAVTPAGVQSASALVSWQLPADMGGGSLLGFRVVMSPAAAETVPSLLPATPLSVTLRGLTPATAYAVSVRAVSSDGSGGQLLGAWSAEVAFTTADPDASGYASFLVASVNILEGAGAVASVPVQRLGGIHAGLEDAVVVASATYLDGEGAEHAIPGGSFTVMDEYGAVATSVGQSVAVRFSTGGDATRVNVSVADDDVYQYQKHVQLCLQHSNGAPSGDVTTCTTVDIVDDGDAGTVALRPQDGTFSVREDSATMLIEVYRVPGCVCYVCVCGCACACVFGSSTHHCACVAAALAPVASCTWKSHCCHLRPP
mgnify:CR=1 FL=1